MNASADMQIYDSLPAPLRRALDGARRKWVAADMLQAYRSGMPVPFIVSAFEAMDRAEEAKRGTIALLTQ